MDFITSLWQTLDQYTFWQNTLQAYVWAGLLLVILVVGLWIFRQIIVHQLSRLLSKTSNTWDDRLISVIQNISPWLWHLGAFYLAIFTLNIPDIVTKILQGVLILWIVIEVTRALMILIEFTLTTRSNTRNETAIFGIKLIAKILLWAIAILMVLSNWGVNISALAASMGIGGIAIALAAQNILSDLFSSFSIYLDKPFEIGDYIVIGADRGTVQKIGLKTTRIQTLQGEELVVSNQELTTTRVQNFKKMTERRINFSVGVTYDTPTEKLKKIPEILEKIISSESKARFDRVHFASFDDWALRFDAVYYVLSQDYAEYMDMQQVMNFSIKEAFESESIEMAFPTQTIHVVKG